MITPEITPFCILVLLSQLHNNIATKENPLLNNVKLKHIAPPHNDFDLFISQSTKTGKQYIKADPFSLHVIVTHRQYLTLSSLHFSSWHSVFDLDKECTNDMINQGFTGKWVAVVAYGAFGSKGLPECESNTEYYNMADELTYISGPSDESGIADCDYNRTVFRHTLSNGSPYKPEYFISGLEDNSGSNRNILNCGDYTGFATLRQDDCMKAEHKYYPNVDPYRAKHMGVGRAIDTGSGADPLAANQFLVDTVNMFVSGGRSDGLLCTQWFEEMRNNNR